MIQIGPYDGRSKNDQNLLVHELYRLEEWNKRIWNGEKTADMYVLQGIDPVRIELTGI